MRADRQSTADYIRFIEDAARQQKRAVREQFLLGASVVAAGVLLVVLAQLFSPESSKLMLQIGGGFVSTLATLRVGPLALRRQRIAALHFMRSGFERIARGELSEAEAERLRERFWSFIDSSLGA